MSKVHLRQQVCLWRPLLRNAVFVGSFVRTTFLLFDQPTFKPDRHTHRKLDSSRPGILRDWIGIEDPAEDLLACTHTGESGLPS